MIPNYPKNVLRKYYGKAVDILEKANITKYPTEDLKLYHVILELLHENDTAFMDALELYFNARTEQDGHMVTHGSDIQQFIRLDKEESIRKAFGWLKAARVRSKTVWHALTRASVLAILRADTTACGQWFVHYDRDEFFTSDCMEESAKFMSQVLRSYP